MLLNTAKLVLVLLLFAQILPAGAQENVAAGKGNIGKDAKSLGAGPKAGDGKKGNEGTFTFQVKGYGSTREIAKQFALEAAQKQIREYLFDQNPPIKKVPSIQPILNHMKM